MYIAHNYHTFQSLPLIRSSPLLSFPLFVVALLPLHFPSFSLITLPPLSTLPSPPSSHSPPPTPSSSLSTLPSPPSSHSLLSLHTPSSSLFTLPPPPSPHTQVESEFYREVQMLEAKYMRQYQPILDKVSHYPKTTPPRPHPHREESDLVAFEQFTLACTYLDLFHIWVELLKNTYAGPCT